MRTGIVKGAILLAIILTVGVVAWVYYAQYKDDREADKADGIGAPLHVVDDSLASQPADTMQVPTMADTVQTQGP